MRGRGRTIAAVLGAALRGAGRAVPDEAALLDCVDLMMQSGSAPLAWSVVRHAVPRNPALHEVLRDAYLHQAGRSLAVRPDLETVWSRLAGAQVEALLAKGPVVADAYLDPALRPYGDFDIYVRPEAHARARDVLGGLGLHRHQVDLHAGASYLDDFGFDGVLATARTARVAGVEVRVPGEEHHLRLVALHALAEGVMRPLWLCDVAVLTLGRRSTFDWRTFLGGDPWRARRVSLAVVLAWTVFELPADALPPALRDVRLPAWAVPSVLRTWSRNAGIKGSRTPMSSVRGRVETVAGLLQRWPTPFEAVSGVGGPVPARWTLPVQLLECVRRLRAAAPKWR